MSIVNCCCLKSKMSELMSANSFIKFQTMSLAVFFWVLPNFAFASEVTIGVASNFLSTMHEIINQFEKETPHRVVVSSGSSGKLYAQIKYGAPFDVFFSADVKRPSLLENEGLAVQGSRFTYAVGKLTLWSADPTMIDEDGESVLSNKPFDHLAIANPKTAPYGTAAKNVLQKLRVWQKIQGRIVQGENIGQAFQFVFSKNAQLGFVALSQVLDRKIQEAGSRWDVPMEFYAPIRQQAVLLLKGRRSEAANAFLDYVKGPKARAVIKQFGYAIE